MGHVTWRSVYLDQLSPAFRDLRKMGVFARTTNLACCATCTHAELSEIAEEYVGYHFQCVPRRWDTPIDRIYLQHHLKPSSVPGVIAVFLSHGIAVLWDGGDKEAILLKPASLWAKRCGIKRRRER